MNRRSFIIGIGSLSLTMVAKFSVARSPYTASRENPKAALHELLKNLNMDLSHERFNELLKSLSPVHLDYIAKINTLFTQSRTDALSVIKKDPRLSSFTISLAKTCYLNKKLLSSDETIDLAPSAVRTMNSKSFNYRATCGGLTGFWANSPTQN